MFDNNGVLKKTKLRRSQIFEEKRHNKSKNLKVKKSKLVERKNQDYQSKYGKGKVLSKKKSYEFKYTQNFETQHVAEDYGSDIVDCMIRRDVSLSCV